MAERLREIEPPELAALVDFQERPRVGDWSLRSALCRYAQPEPQRVSDLLDLVRRIEAVLGPQLDQIERDGPAIWEAVEGATRSGPAATGLVELLATVAEIDGLADQLAAWADDRAAVERPDDAVDAVTAEVRDRLAALGVPEQERPGPPRGARSRG